MWPETPVERCSICSIESAPCSFASGRRLGGVGGFCSAAAASAFFASSSSRAFMGAFCSSFRRLQAFAAAARKSSGRLGFSLFIKLRDRGSLCPRSRGRAGDPLHRPTFARAVSPPPRFDRQLAGLTAKPCQRPGRLQPCVRDARRRSHRPAMYLMSLEFARVDAHTACRPSEAVTPDFMSRRPPFPCRTTPR